eukprot:6678604-Prorocentrum_lima.AAC.1
MGLHSKDVTVGEMVRKASCIRNMSVSYGGKTPAEAAFGRRPPDILQTATMDPGRFSSEMHKEDKAHQR